MALQPTFNFSPKHPVVPPTTAGKSGSLPVRFQGLGAVVNPANQFVSWFTRNLYDRGEGVRYAVEQTLGYTAPRTVQQLNRTRSITGESNPLAAKEMLARDLAADFADTFLPGLIATLGIGYVADKINNTYVRHNMGRDALHFYEKAMAAAPDKSQFFRNIEQHLNAHAGSTTPVQVGLEKLVEGIQSKKGIDAVVEQVAERLNLSHFDLALGDTAKEAAAAGGHKLEIALPELIRDLWHLNKPNTAIKTAEHWGGQMAHLLEKTISHSRYQMWGNIAALVASVSIPFGIRLMTRKKYGEDAFPGTKELEKHFKNGKLQNQAAPEAEGGKKKKKFEWFPYLKHSLKEGKVLPTLITAGFFAVLGGAVLRRFSLKGLSPAKLQNWFKVYEFQRSFPFTTVEQMELTYGLLCGTRLASSRDESEFRETGIRDCLLGWPTLTYFFPWFRKKLGNALNGGLTKRFNQPNLLMKPNGEVRTGDEITSKLLGNLGLKDTLDSAVKSTKLTQAWVTFLSAATSWGLLAFAEPKLGIWLTNRFEVDKMKKEAQNAQPSLFGGQAVRQPVNLLGAGLHQHQHQACLFDEFQRLQRA